jgi:hypothetical protein
MATENIKKVIIKQSDLPPLMVENQGYVFRYRIISDDKNRRSHWSPIKNIKPEFTFVAKTINHDKAGAINTVVWDAVTIKKGTNTIKQADSYDVWLKWHRGDNADWIHHGTINNNSFSIVTPSTYTISDVEQVSAPNKLNIEVYLKGSPITRSSSFLRVYQGGPYTV